MAKTKSYIIRSNILQILIDHKEPLSIPEIVKIYQEIDPEQDASFGTVDYKTVRNFLEKDWHEVFDKGWEREILEKGKRIQKNSHGHESKTYKLRRPISDNEEYEQLLRIKLGAKYLRIPSFR